ncbi:peptide ABC transporter substrate-binding protein [Peribacillus butanolivorans]|uniref:Peptide ABC transporter substrate-binding protein n=1 Tax=Peribacillus butanolivorans TaxID=421767 RepID=A0AAX0RQK2_9BACI|nr:ABC transporter substrate-binding protein [Peribacillus butanolivorans]MCO0600497.1 ABC transporter substrate-binding protein [Peribacillus butanolivorans]PEJ27227.1 peptide ABC transporter substrate-binding protein [Peribacillus butanolivorans]
MKIRIKPFFLTVLVFSLILSGCSSNENKAVTSNEESKINDRTLEISVGPDMLTWDIHNHVTTATEAIHVNVFDYLLMRDEKGEIKPHLAKSWENINPTTWQFELNENVMFHNGDPLTSEDVKFTLERVAKDTKLRSNSDYNTIKEIKVIDDYTFQIISQEPDPMLLSRISRQASGILPKKYIEENGWEHFKKHPIGSGPLQFVEWVRDDRIVLEPFEDYFNQKVTDWDKVVFRAIPEDSTRVSELLTKNLDIAVNIPTSDWKRIQDADGVSVVDSPSNRTYMLFLRTQKGWPTADEKVREAIDYAIDDGAIVKYLLEGYGTPSLTRVNPGDFGMKEDLYGKYNFDVEYSKKLLAEAGYSNGLSITLSGPNGRYIKDREILQVISGMLDNVGIETDTNILTWNTFVEHREKQEFKEGYLIALGSSFFDAGQSLDYYSSSRSESINGYNNEEVDQLLKEAETVLNEQVREQNYHRVQEIAKDERPIIPIFQMNQFFGVNDQINFEPRLDELIYVPDITHK